MPKALLTEPLYSSLGSDGILLYSLILDRAQLSKRNEYFIDENGAVFVFFTVEEIIKIFGCGKEKASEMLRSLEHFGLVKLKRQTAGKPRKIYPLDFDKQVGKTDLSRSENPPSAGPESPFLQVGKSAPNKTYNNKTDIIQSDSIGEGYGENAESQPGAYGGFGKNTVLEWVKRLEQEKAEPEPHTKYSFNNGSIAERAKKLSQEQDNLR